MERTVCLIDNFLSIFLFSNIVLIVDFVLCPFPELFLVSSMDKG